MTSDSRVTDADSTDRVSLEPRIAGVVFGDRLGLVVFLGTLACVAAWWRIGFFITDSTTVANALVNVGNGRLAVVETPYSLTLGSQPGLHRVGDQVFGRNYGHVLLALPVLWLLEALTAVTDTALLVPAVWSLLLVALAGQIAAISGRPRIHSIGAVIALLVFVGNVATAQSLSEGSLPWAAASTGQSGPPLALIALQVTTMLAAAVVATTTYRLLARFHGRRVGVAAGFGAVLATPVGFWASIPKRHVLTAAVVVVVLFCFAVSREESGRPGMLARGAAYAALGLLTSVHPFEALFLFLVLVPVDVLTAPSNGSRTLGFVGVVFVLSLVPFFLVNTLISGNPIRPPRLLPGVAPDIDLQPAVEPDTPEDGTGGATGGDGGGGGTDGGGSEPGTDSTPEETGSDGGTTGSGEGEGDGSTTGSNEGGGIGSLLPLDTLLGPISRGVGYWDRVVGFTFGFIDDGFRALGEPERLYHTFVRSGRIPGVGYAVNDFEAVELALLESFPLAGALLWLPAIALQRARDGLERSGFGQPARQTDLLAAAFALVFVAVYLPRLPLKSQVTLRYILPVMPLLLYGLARLAVVRRPIEAVPHWLAGAYAAVVLGGGVSIAGALAVIDPAVGEAVQFQALVGLGTATVAAASALTWPLHGSDRLLAVGLALPAGVTTVFLTLASVAYFDYGRYALGLVRVLSELMPLF